MGLKSETRRKGISRINRENGNERGLYQNDPFHARVERKMGVILAEMSGYPKNHYKPTMGAIRVNIYSVFMFDERLFQNRYRVPSIRMPGWDYRSPGAYFITICTKNRLPWFGEIHDQTMALSDIGRIADACWREIPNHFPHVTLDALVVMPNHVHGIIILRHDDRSASGVASMDAFVDISVSAPGAASVETQNFASLPTKTDVPLPHAQPIKTDPTMTDSTAKTDLPSGNRFGPQSRNVGSVIRGYKIGVTKYAKQYGYVDFAWQPRFYEFLIRDAQYMENARRYIVNNPMKWESDTFHRNDRNNCK